MIIVLHSWSWSVRSFADLYLENNSISITTFQLHYAAFIYLFSAFDYYFIVNFYVMLVFIILGLTVCRFYSKKFSWQYFSQNFHFNPTPQTYTPSTLFDLSFFIHRELFEYKIILNLFSLIDSIFLLAFFLCIYFPY